MDEPAATSGDVYAEVEGLSGEERRRALIELATGECEPIDLYTSINAEISQSMLEQFTEDTGVPALLYGAANEDVNRRVLQEEAAAADLRDVIANSDLAQAIPAREGILVPLDTPATERNSVVHDTWAGGDRLVHMAAWSDWSRT